MKTFAELKKGNSLDAYFQLAKQASTLSERLGLIADQATTDEATHALFQVAAVYAYVHMANRPQFRELLTKMFDEIDNTEKAMGVYDAVPVPPCKPHTS